jgi:hypothetical protein
MAAKTSILMMHSAGFGPKWAIDRDFWQITVRDSPGASGSTRGEPYLCEARQNRKKSDNPLHSHIENPSTRKFCRRQDSAKAAKQN